MGICLVVLRVLQVSVWIVCPCSLNVPYTTLFGTKAALKFKTTDLTPDFGAGEGNRTLVSMPAVLSQ
jgi:hypothetical protein